MVDNIFDIFKVERKLGEGESPILTQSSRAVGSAATTSELERGVNQLEDEVSGGYQVLSKDETDNIRYAELNMQLNEINASDFPETDKEFMAKEIMTEMRNVTAESDLPLEIPWVDPIDAVAGPLAFAKGTAKVFSTLSRGALSGPGTLALSNGSLQKALAASLIVETGVGQGIDILQDELEDTEMPWYYQEAIKLGIGIGVGGYAQAKTENAITAIADVVRQNGRKISTGQVKKAVNRAKTNLEEELSLVTIEKGIIKKETRKAFIESFKAPKKASKLTPGQKAAADVKASKTQLFSDEIVTNPDTRYANLDQVKKSAKDIFPDSFQEAEAIEEFFTSKPMARKLIARLKDSEFQGVAEEGYAHKFFGDEKIKVDIGKEVLSRAKAHAGANTVTGMTGGLFAGLETNEEGEITGFNPSRALMVGIATAAGGGFAINNYSKFIAGIKGLKNTGKATQALEQKLLKETTEKMATVGTDPLKVALGTGWYKGKDGRLRKYIPNEEVSLRQTPAQIKKWEDQQYDINDVLDFPVMSQYYGDTVMSGTKVVYNPNVKGAFASYNMIDDVISLHDLGDSKKLLESVIHETQHAIQKYEGFSAGTNSQVMGYVFDKATGVLAKPKAERSLEEINLLESWGDSVKQLSIVDKNDIQLSIQNSIRAFNKNDIELGMAEVELARSVYTNSAYNAAYGEVEARAASRVRPVTTALTKLADLNEVLNKEAIQVETLIGPLWDSMLYQKTGRSLDPNMFATNMMEKKGIPASIVKRWEDYADKRIITPFQHWVDSKIYSGRLREQFGINLPRRYRALIEDYDRQTNRILDHTMTLADKLNKLAPTQKEQKRLMQVLRGGVTSDPELAQAATQVQEAYKELRVISQEMGLRSYDMYDAFTKTELNQLRGVVNFSSNTDAVLGAQEAIKAHYTVGTAYEYVPTFLKSKEGVTIAERKKLTKQLNHLKALARKATDVYDDEPLPHLRDEIAEIEDILAINANNAFNTNRKLLSQGYQNVLAPAEANTLLYKSEDGINSASFTAARGLTEMALDIQRKGFLDSVAKNTDWVLPKDTNKEFVPQHFTQLKGERYGSLNGSYVDKVIAKDINDLGEVTNSFIRNYDKVLGLWKLGKAVYNPATHAANFTSNMFLAHLGGVNPGDLKTYGQAAQAIQSRMTNKWFREAEGWGLLNNTFSAAELSQFRKSLSSFRNQPKTVTTGQKVQDMLSGAMGYPSTLYEKNEQFFKLAVFIKARKQGESIEASAKKAEEYLFNYRDIPPIVRHYKRWASPFFTFTYKASGLMAKEIVRHPQRLAMWGAAYLSWQAIAQDQTGSTAGDVKSDREKMPGFGVFDMLMPWKDRDGNRQYWDISRLVPLGQYSEKWGQTGLPLSSFAPTANPLTAVMYELAVNKDLFTGREIYNTDIDGLTDLAGKWAGHIYKEMTPSLAPGNYGYNNLMKGLKSLDNQVIDYTGQEITMQDMVLRTIFAFKVNSATEEAMFKSFKSEITRIDRGIGMRINQYKTQYRRGEISAEEFEAAQTQLENQRIFLQYNLLDRME